MVEIKYGDQYEVADMAGLTVSEAREQFRTEFGIPDKAKAKLNGSKVRTSVEGDTVLNDDDKLSFAVSRSRGAYLIGAMLLALVVTGGVFAYGFINAATTLNATVKAANFADVSVNTTGVGAIGWTGYGFFKGALKSTDPAHSVNGTPIFNIDTVTSGYAGDLVVSVSLGNADQLAKQYRTLAMQLIMVDSSNVIMDINENGYADNNDWVMLTLNNGEVSMFPGGVADNMSVRVKSGFYITHARPFAGWEGSASPDLFCEVAQR
jgi:molybdopterin converting factor small subunit